MFPWTDGRMVVVGLLCLRLLNLFPVFVVSEFVRSYDLRYLFNGYGLLTFSRNQSSFLTLLFFFDKYLVLRWALVHLLMAFYLRRSHLTWNLHNKLCRKFSRGYHVSNCESYTYREARYSEPVAGFREAISWSTTYVFAC